MPARGPAEALPGQQVVVHRPLAGQRAVAIGIGKQHPAVGGAGHHDRQGVTVASLPLRSAAGEPPSGSSQRCRRSRGPRRPRRGPGRIPPAAVPPRCTVSPRGRDRRERHRCPRRRSRAGRAAWARRCWWSGDPGRAGSMPVSRMPISTPRPSKVGCAWRNRSAPVLASAIQPWAKAASGGAMRSTGASGGGVSPRGTWTPGAGPGRDRCCEAVPRRLGATARGSAPRGGWRRRASAPERRRRLAALGMTSSSHQRAVTASSGGKTKGPRCGPA